MATSTSAATAWREKWSNSFTFAPPPHPSYNLEAVIQACFDEDSAGIGDITTLATVDAEAKAEATFLAKDDGIIAGLGVVDMVFRMQDPACSVAWSVKEGDRVTHGQKFGVVRGPARALLIGERVALNLLQRMSGVATSTRKMVDAIGAQKTKILETRKTIPGLRLLDKWAVLIGGGSNHRMGLFDMIMIKDNHVAAAGGIIPAIHRAEAYLREKGIEGTTIEVECRTMEEVRAVIGYLDSPEAQGRTRVRRIMLDNMTRKDASKPSGIDIELLREAVGLIEGRVETEASGNVTLETVGEIAKSGVDLISSGALTHSVKALDISLNIEL